MFAPVWFIPSNEGARGRFAIHSDAAGAAGKRAAINGCKKEYTVLTRVQIQRLVYKHGREVFEHDHMEVEKRCYQHGAVTTFAHSIRVACLAVWLADRLHLWHRVDLHALIRSALLHDYFLYDWHDWDNGTHRLHGFTHGHTALRNAARDFDLNHIERDAIAKHMFPMTPVPPKYIEGYLVTMADKISATRETFSRSRFHKPMLHK